MAERTVSFGKADPVEMTGRVYVDRAPVVASWYQAEGEVKIEALAETIGTALGRPVEIVDRRHEGDGQYNCIIRYL